jgi:hypothetical protein
MDVENLPEVQAEIVLNEGWSEDDSGLPVFTAGSADLIENELVTLRATEGEQRLKLAAVLAEASDRRFYGDNTLKTVAKENQITYGTARSMVAGYKRLKDLNVDDRETMVAIIKSGELYWSKVQIAASVKDDQSYVELMHASADGSLSNSKLRKRVQTITGQGAIEGAQADEDGAEEDVEDAEVVEEDQEPESHADSMARFITGAYELAKALEESGGIKTMQPEEVPDELTPLVKLMRRWDDQLRRKLKGE